MTLVKFNNQRGTNALLPGYNDVFESIFNDTFFNHRTSFVPPVNISESADYYHIEMAVPGLKKSDFRLRVEKDVLTIESQAEKQTTDNDRRYNKREFSFSSFTRSFNLPELADHNLIEASYQDGVLKVDIGKLAEAKTLTREIELK